MKSKSLSLMLIAIGCGLVAAYLTAKLTAGPSEAKVAIPVATAEVKIGTVIKEPAKFFAMTEVSEAQAAGRVDAIEKLKDKIVTRTVRAGESVYTDDLSANFGINPPKGHKAMAIKTTPDAAVAGFIMPGSRVDVLATIEEGQGKQEVLTVLQNQEVLAVDKISMRPDGQSAVDTINTVTLAVTPMNAQKLELALKKSGGTVRLLLRDQNDTTVHKINGLKNLHDSTADFASATADGVQLKALAAKSDIPAGTVIDDPEKLFTAVPVAIMPERGYQEPDLGKLKGQTVRVPLFKDSFITMKHVETSGDKGMTSAPEPIRTVLFIQNGGKEPQMIVYQDGVMVSGESANAKTNEKPAEKPAETTPTDKNPS